MRTPWRKPHIGAAVEEEWVAVYKLLKVELHTAEQPLKPTDPAWQEQVLTVIDLPLLQNLEP